MRLKDTPSVARWTTRVALFSCLLALVALAAHRFGPMPTLTAFNLVVIAFVGALLALMLGVVASIVIWREGRSGAFRVACGVVMALGLIGWPVAFLGAYRNLPAINDVSTDANSPPKFVDLVKVRGPGSNPAIYPIKFAKLQAEAYPDLKPMLIDRPVEETFEIAREAVFRQKMTIIHEQAPENKPGHPGVIEATDRTVIFGLYDDIAVRVDGDNTRSRIDLRSASRFGQHDLGRNAERMRRLMREIVARLEATIPSATGESYVKWRKRGQRLLTKKAQEAGQASKDKSKSGGPSQTGGRREPEPKAGPRSKEGGQSPSKRSQRSQE
jgi:uncharacterized protein (DUF1499 family)